MTSWLATGPPVMCWVAPARVVTSWPAEKFCVIDRKSTRLNSSHSQISYAVFCLKKKKTVPATLCHSVVHYDALTYHHQTYTDQVLLNCIRTEAVTRHAAAIRRSTKYTSILASY